MNITLKSFLDVASLAAIAIYVKETDCRRFCRCMPRPQEKKIVEMLREVAKT